MSHSMVALLPSCLITVWLSSCSSSYQSDAQGPHSRVSAHNYRATRVADEQAPSDLAGFVALALRQRPELAAAHHRYQASAEQVALEDLLPDPTISYSGFLRSIETRLGPQRHKLSLRQALPWTSIAGDGKRAATHETRALERRFAAEALVIKREVAGAYWQLWRVGEERRVHSEHRELVQELHKTTLSRIEIGAASLADARQVDLRGTRLDDLLLTMAASEQRATASLAGVVGLSQLKELGPTQAPPAPRLPADSLEVLLAAVEAHPALLFYEERAKARDARLLQAESRGRPGFVFGLDYIEVGPMDGAVVANEGRDAVVATLGISVPLWRTAIGARVRKARAQAAVERATGEANTVKAQATIRSLWISVTDSSRKIHLYQQALLPQAEGVYEALIGDYQISRANLSALLLAQTEILELQVQLTKARASHEIAWAELEAAVGKRIEVRRMGEGDTSHVR